MTLPILKPYRTGLGPNQACTLYGAESGSDIISGRNYVQVGFGLQVSDLWKRNLLVLIAFLIAFQITQVIALEYFPVSLSYYRGCSPDLRRYISNTAPRCQSTSSPKKTRTRRSAMLLFVNARNSAQTKGADSGTRSRMSRLRLRNGVYHVVHVLNIN